MVGNSYFKQKVLNKQGISRKHSSLSTGQSSPSYLFFSFQFIMKQGIKLNANTAYTKRQLKTSIWNILIALFAGRLHSFLFCLVFLFCLFVSLLLFFCFFVFFLNVSFFFFQINIM